MRKELLRYKDKIILIQKGRWTDLYVNGSLVHANMSKAGGVKVFWSYVKTEKKFNKED